MTQPLLCAANCRTDEPRQAAPGYRICWACNTGLGNDYNALADLAPDLEAALSRTNIVGEERVGGTPGRGLELNTEVAAARWQIHHDMATTVRLVIEERGLSAYPSDDIQAMATWLHKHTNWLAAHPSAGERANEARGWLSAARKAINPNPPKYVEVGPCVRKDCDGTLVATVRPQDSLLPSAITCTWWRTLTEEEREQLVEDGAEPHTWRADQWHALGRQVEAQRRAAVTA